MGIGAGPGAARRGAVPLRAEDALFLHAQTPLLCQQVGAMLLLDAAAITIEDFRAAMRERMRDVPELRRRLERPRNPWRRPRWIPDDAAGDGERIRQVTLGGPGSPSTLDEAADAFFSSRCDPGRHPWEMLLIRGVPAGRSAVLVKVHHTLGDSHAIIAMLTKLFDPEPGAAGRGRRRDPGPGPGRRPSVRARARTAGRILRGLGHLARAGRAPSIGVCGRFTGDRRRYVPLNLPAREVAMTARRLDTGITELLLAVIAEAVGRMLSARGDETAGRTIRIAVPRSRPAARGPCGHSPGNQSAAVAVDLPLGPLPAASGLAAVRGQVAAHLRRGDPDAAAMVLHAMNFLPPPLQGRVAAQLYRHRWFNMLVSVFPGVRRGHRVLGARVAEVYPVLALADGVGLSIGAMTWERSLSVGILADAALVPDVERLAAEFTGAFRGYLAAAARQADSAGVPAR